LPACPHCAAVLAEEARFCGHCGTFLTEPAGGPTTADPWLGRIVDRRYRVVALVGSGGMGVVYRVEHLHLGKMAAMKVLSPETATKPEMLRRFRTEAQAISKLNHPNIVQTFDFGQSDGALYLVMEYVGGDDLSALLRRDGPWTFTRAARLFAQVCSGLTEAHEAGIVHRDLKPENLMVVRRRDGSEHVKVLDFGLAKLRERGNDPQDAAVSSGGQVLGTPYYMAPEQVRGEPLDARADLYSVGATLYRVLTGEPPFDAPSPISVLAKHLTEEVIPPRARRPDRALPPEADRIVLRAMAKSPADRYASAAELQADLEAALVALNGTSSPSSSSPPLSSPLGADDGAVTLAASEAPTMAIEDSDIADISELGEVGDRLRRSDVDDFEWSMRRRRWLTRLVLPLVGLAIAGGAVLFARSLGERADIVEHEPNNTPGYANLLGQGSPIRGTIGKRGEGGQGDVDFFRLPPGQGARLVSARLEGIPNVDLVLELYDGQGRRIAKSDAAGRGWGEWLQPTSIGPAEVYLAVRELWVEGVPPTEDAPDPYTLTVRWGPPQTGWEIEPNDSPSDATPMAAPGRVRGYLGSADDRDWFSIAVTAPTTLVANVTAPAGVDVVLLHQGAGKELVVNKRGAGESEQLSIEALPGKPLFIGVARKQPAKGDTTDAKAHGLPGLDDPYELTIESSPSPK
jgi:serine/threonine protein kinase